MFPAVHQCWSVPSLVAVSGDSSCQSLDLRADNDTALTSLLTQCHAVLCVHGCSCFVALECSAHASFWCEFRSAVYSVQVGRALDL